MYIAYFIKPFVATRILFRNSSRALSVIATVVLCYSLFLLGPPTKALAQNDQGSLVKQVLKEDQSAVDAIAMYPPETRKDIFTACEFPEIVVRLNTMQKNTNDMFKQLLGTYSQDEQDKIYDLTRYPDLIAELSEPYGTTKTLDDLTNIALKYPEHIRPIALAEAQTNPALLDTIDSQNHLYQSQFQDMLNGYPPEAVTAFSNLIKQPEILSLLADNMQLTVVVGDVYKKNPDHVMHKADSLNAVLTAQGAQETTDWQNNMNSDTAAQSDYVQAAQDYAQENGYASDETSTPLDPSVSTVVTEPYNWWFGYPDWYPYAYWDPYPYWYDWGFYFGPGRHAVFFGTPSSHFMDWYFYNPEHHYRYAHLSSVYYDYSLRHHDGAYNPIVRSVNDWRARNGDIVTTAWDKDPANRGHLFKEYGREEMDRTAYNKKNPQHPVEHQDFLKMNSDRYHLIAQAQGRQVTPHPPGYVRRPPEPILPAARPYWKVPDSYKAPANPVRENRQPQDNPRPVTPIHVVPPSQPVISPQIRTANQVHQSSWQQIRPQPQPQRTAPPPRPQPQRSAPPRMQPPSSGGHRGH